MPSNRLHDNLLSQRYGVYLICLYVVSFATVLYVDSNLPEPLLISDELNHPDEFIAERAYKFLNHLTDLGPRIVGGKSNEIDAVALIQNEIKQIMSTATTRDQDDISTETWEVSGSYYLAFKPHGAINAYGNVQNIIVVLKSKSKKRSGKAILLNAHFDSVPTSPGGSDDGIMCSVMLELLRKLIHTPAVEPPLHDVIFLWNGAEETPLHASHGFISHLHSFSTSNSTMNTLGTIPRILINLESGGGGPGRAILFQSGPKGAWLVREYGRVAKYPHGNVGGEEMFKANLVPSDTDFRVFRDFGKMQGYDFAFARGGYRYHTKYDTFGSIPLGSYQQVGTNILSLLRALRNASVHLLNDIDDIESEPEVVYFDVLYKYMVEYSVNTATVVNTIVAVLSIGMAAMFVVRIPKRQRLTVLLHSASSVGISWLLAAAIVFLTALLLDKFGLSMRWYRFPIIVSTLYVVPAAVAAAAGVLLVDKCFSNSTILPSRRVESLIHTTRTIITVFLIIGTFYEIRTSYAICIPILINIIGLFSRYLPAVIKASVVTISEFMWAVFIFYQFLLIFSLFIPITGRFGSDRNPEFVVGGISLLLTFLLLCFQIPRIYTIKHPWRFLLSLLGLSLIISGTTIVCFDTYSGDYASPTPQRFWIFHTNRVIRDKEMNITMSDSGYFLLNLDRNSPKSVLPYVEELRTSGRQVGDDCDKALLCGLPLISPRMLAIARESTWVPSTTQAIFSPSNLAKLQLRKREVLPKNIQRLYFVASGPDRINVYISPRDGAEVRNISLAVVTATPVNSLDSGRPLYFINYVWGRRPRDLEFYIDLEVESDGTAGILDIAVSGKDVHGVKSTPEFQKFLKQFPDWADVTAAQATFESFVF